MLWVKRWRYHSQLKAGAKLLMDCTVLTKVKAPHNLNFKNPLQFLRMLKIDCNVNVMHENVSKIHGKIVR